MKFARVQLGGHPETAIVRENGDLFGSTGLLAGLEISAARPDVPLDSHGLTPLVLASLPMLQNSVADAIRQLEQQGRLSEFLLPAGTPLLSPLPRPNRILAIGRNYAEHARELGNAVPEEPVVFLKASTSIIGPDANIEIPGWIGRVDYEAELLVVIGKGGKNIAPTNAMEHVAGYSVFNDVTARDRQRAAQEKKHPWFLAKSLDTFGPLGPYFVTKDEVPDPHNLRVTLTVNGEIRQNDSTASMLHTVPQLIAYLSRWMALEAGDVIATGTPSGVGPLVPGDVVEATVEGIGTLRNLVVAV